MRLPHGHVEPTRCTVEYVISWTHVSHMSAMSVPMETSERKPCVQGKVSLNIFLLANFCAQVKYRHVNQGCNKIFFDNIFLERKISPHL
jgi:hypothetical protein